ncbi:tetrahydromethanopterin:alpha-L-glutamate ligase [Methanosarcina mazei]|jgi:tetrahydromethanopterin:alpha-L-glutamate ligase|uniref:RimK family alpha-L-glutamate ligase n=5 Tax=Methanosarcina mazei TaxID=2209 RepID=A0A0F8HCW5_METMZ|nr:tetrahydromethanopterin:alpha-L-glutamate ligase [Methanosarcina mazei]AKB40184.1 Tetrahydromethanopterin:alpha-L-glutamate ligase [Methanosarcina mazei WWM610]AKB61101.1 Tetrahydromethanopterin:alpha-L-glutamate ligase [Methanosarcina mazei SarPi]AKB67747.1 Tetrahydromethanopterin:alpha-L-glutamate ligase [Methanosarcina mazei LYC]AKB72452.1 Tetrahydromethanopterin:alpha-L-glutamate ligase [Methanosarcina mazei C16]KKG06188.1 tetrahydromethanopterin:alpha-L-glutamate ligase [Methanosarcina
MKKIGIAITDPEDWTARALIKAAKEKGFSPLVFDLSDAEVRIGSGISEPASIFKAGEVLLSDLDALIVRDVGAGAFEGVSFRFDILRELEAEGVSVINSPEAIQNAANKYHASYLLAKAGLPVPETVAVQSLEAALKVISEFGDAVIKPVFGYKGKDIARVKNREIRFSDRKIEPAPVEEILEKLLEEKGMLYIQEFIENPGRDIRAFVVGGTAIGAIYRKAAAGSWVNNLSQGGSSDRCVLTDEQEKIAEKASLALGTTFAGIDIIEGTEESEENKKTEGMSSENRKSPRILEVNGTPSGKGIFDAWGINPADHILEHLKNIL